MLWFKELKKSWDLSEVKEVATIQDWTTITHSYFTIWVFSGLKITLLEDILHVTTPDAARLGQQILELVKG